MKTARERWFARLLAERERRRYAELLVDGCDPREALIQRLDQMAERMMADPHFVMPDQKELSRDVDRWFKERFPKAR
jgi:hypothetical protein